jgi:hypothetical protein
MDLVYHKAAMVGVLVVALVGTLVVALVGARAGTLVARAELGAPREVELEELQQKALVQAQADPVPLVLEQRTASQAQAQA